MTPLGWENSAVYSVDILDNTVSGVVATSGGNTPAYGIYTDANPSGSISGNRVRGLLPAGFAAAFGIYNIGLGRLTLRNNDLIGAGNYGLACEPFNNSNAKDNVISGFTVGLLYCYDGGGNLIR